MKRNVGDSSQSLTLALCRQARGFGPLSIRAVLLSGVPVSAQEGAIPFWPNEIPAATRADGDGVGQLSALH
ncbi:MAG: hypothetical protein ACRD1P_04405 [Thermoanaerobaculia bacterium]